jgi:hypothetical protein
MSTTPRPSIKKTEEAEQLVYGEVYAPGFPDSQGDFMTAETIKKMAFDFMMNGFTDAIDSDHTRVKNGVKIVESFIARDDDTLYIPNSWVIGVKCPDDVWARVQKGELNGFSIDGSGFQVDTVLEIELPDTLEGETTAADDGHSHKFMVKYDEEGNFLGGATTPAADGHVHTILRGTLTETTDGHAHRFSFVEGVLRAEVAD